MNFIDDKRIAIVTGSSKGIGREIARLLAIKNIHVVIIGRSQKKLEELHDQIIADNGTCTIACFDLKNIHKIYELSEIIYERFHKIDILILNAAIITNLSPVQFIEVEIFEEIMRTNVTANLALITAFDKLLKISKNPQIIGITDNLALSKEPFWAGYAASKAAFEKILAIYKEENKNINNMKIDIFSPSPTNTELRKIIFPGEDKDKLTSPMETARKIVSLIN